MNLPKIAIICSTKDTASENIKEHLLKIKEWNKKDINKQLIKENMKKDKEINDYKKLIVSYYSLNEKKGYDIDLIEFNERLIYLERLDLLFDYDYFIFISKHKSQSEKPALTVHSIGNWDKAELGGKEKTLSIAWPNFLHNGFINLKNYVKKNNLNIEVTPEVTHHGPLIKKPCSFIEIGSSEKQWKNNKYGEAIAKVVIKTLSDIFEHKTDNINKKSNKQKKQIVFAIGGGHYCTSFIKIYDKLYFGHICPKYYAKNINKEMLIQAINSSSPKANIVILDWKNIKSDEKHKIYNTLNNLKNEIKDLKVVKLKEIKKELENSDS